MTRLMFIGSIADMGKLKVLNLYLRPLKPFPLETQDVATDFFLTFRFLCTNVLHHLFTFHLIRRSSFPPYLYPQSLVGLLLRLPFISNVDDESSKNRVSQSFSLAFLSGKQKVRERESVRASSH